MQTHSIPFLSIVMPVYNGGTYLRACIESLQKQEGDCSVEFICVDDGSTDDSPQLLDAWAATDDRVRVIHQKNGGYGKAMNAGIAQARGSYIGIAEPDDRVAPHYCSTLSALAHSTQADIVKGTYIEVNGDTQRVISRLNRSEEPSVFAPCCFPNFLQGSPCIWSGIYRRDMLEAANIRFAETPGASFQDLGFFMRTWAAASSIATTKESVYYYRKDNPASSIHRKEEGAWVTLREIELTQDLFDSLPLEERVKRTLLLRRVFHSMMADYKHRVCDTRDRWLTTCSSLLNRLAPQELLLQHLFTRNEWHDLTILYTRPGNYPAARKLGASALQRIFSVRTEGGRRYVRFLGAKFAIGKTS